MRQVKNEDGNSLVYIMWLLSMCGVIILIVLNITGVYMTKQNASTATEQAALAGTAVMMKATDDAIKDFDKDLIRSLDQKLDDTLKSVETLVQEKKEEYKNAGKNDQTARILAYNAIIPERLIKYPEMLEVFKDKFGSQQLANDLNREINYILNENGTMVDTAELVLSNTDWRIEVKASASFSTITDGKYLNEFAKDIPQKGVGPKLAYLEYIY